ncbi:MAG: DHHA1 domain-containing protein, partial [Clostridia bacterium]
EHTEIIVNYGIEIAGVQAAFLAIEQKEGIKISMRSLPPIDVAHVAARWGGGGHTQAAGCMLDMPLLQAMDTMQEQIQKEMGVY